jgi:hypothetical protein
MMFVERYRLVHTVLALLFCAFTVGVPVVLASCPMMADGTAPGRASCCADAADRTQTSVAAYKNTSCCETKIAATRNTQEFLQSGADHGCTTVLAAFPALVAPAALLESPASVSGRARWESSPPPVSADLPVLYSALLI